MFNLWLRTYQRCNNKHYISTWKYSHSKYHVLCIHEYKMIHNNCLIDIDTLPDLQKWSFLAIIFFLISAYFFPTLIFIFQRRVFSIWFYIWIADKRSKAITICHSSCQWYFVFVWSLFFHCLSIKPPIKMEFKIL